MKRVILFYYRSIETYEIRTMRKDKSRKCMCSKSIIHKVGERFKEKFYRTGDEIQKEGWRITDPLS